MLDDDEVARQLVDMPLVEQIDDEMGEIGLVEVVPPLAEVDDEDEVVVVCDEKEVVEL